MDPESHCPRELPWLFPDRRRYRSACLPAGGAVQPRCWPGGASLPGSPPPGAWGVGAGVFSTAGAASNKKASQGCKARSSVVLGTQCMLVWRLHKHACRLTTFQRVNYLSGTLSWAELTRARRPPSHSSAIRLEGRAFSLRPLDRGLLQSNADSSSAPSWLYPLCQEPRGRDRDLAKLLANGRRPSERRA